MEKMEKLPPEILSQIAQNLEGKDLVALTGTNENISQPLSNHRLLWKRHLDVSDQPGLSPLKKSIPDHSRNCPEKDEFLLRMRLEKNWSNFNYEVCDTIPPRDAGQTEMRLACLYADFAVFFHPLGRNTWNIIIFDSEISKFQSVTFTVPCPTECYWRASEMTLHKIHVGSSRRLFVFELFCDEAFQQEIVVFDISKEGGSNILWRSSYEKSASLIELAKDFLYIFRVSLTNLSVQILDASTGQNIGQAVDNSINKTNFQLRPIKANRHQEVGQKIDKIVVGSKLHGASIFKKVSSFITYDTTKNCFDWWQNEDSKELTQVGNKICLKKWSGLKVIDLKSGSTVWNVEFKSQFRQLHLHKELFFIEDDEFGDQTQFRKANSVELGLQRPRWRTEFRLHRDLCIEFDENNLITIAKFPIEGRPPKINSKTIGVGFDNDLEDENGEKFIIDRIYCLQTAMVIKFYNKFGYEFLMALNFNI